MLPKPEGPPLKVRVVPEIVYIEVFTVVTCVRLKRLNASARTSIFLFSVMEKRRERRRSTYQMFGCLKKLRGMSAKRVEPPDPLEPPPGVKQEAVTPPLVQVLNPNAEALTLPETVPV